jgi:hypothetical protein
VRTPDPSGLKSLRMTHRVSTPTPISGNQKSIRDRQRNVCRLIPEASCWNNLVNPFLLELFVISNEES